MPIKQLKYCFRHVNIYYAMRLGLISELLRKFLNNVTISNTQRQHPSKMIQKACDSLIFYLYLYESHHFGACIAAP